MIRRRRPSTFVFGVALKLTYENSRRDHHWRALSRLSALRGAAKLKVTGDARRYSPTTDTLRPLLLSDRPKGSRTRHDHLAACGARLSLVTRNVQRSEALLTSVRLRPRATDRVEHARSRHTSTTRQHRLPDHSRCVSPTFTMASGPTENFFSQSGVQDSLVCAAHIVMSPHRCRD